MGPKKEGEEGGCSGNWKGKGQSERRERGRNTKSRTIAVWAYGKVSIRKVSLQRRKSRKYNNFRIRLPKLGAFIPSI